jgi:hypothetical protein
MANLKLPFKKGTKAAYAAIPVKNPDEIYILKDAANENNLFLGTIPLGKSVINEFVIYLDAVNGNDLTGDGTQTKPWKTFAHGLAQVNGADYISSRTITINFAAGNYTTGSTNIVHVYANKVNFTGAGIDSTTLQGILRFRGSSLILVSDINFTATTAQIAKLGSNNGVVMFDTVSLIYANKCIFDCFASTNTADVGGLYVTNSTISIRDSSFVGGTYNIVSSSSRISVSTSTFSHATSKKIIAKRASIITTDLLDADGSLDTDGTSNVVNWGADNYSTTEKWTGEFLNGGKPIFRRLFTGDITATGGVIAITNLITTPIVDSIVDCGGWVQAATSKYALGSSMFTSDSGTVAGLASCIYKDSVGGYPNGLFMKTLSPLGRGGASTGSYAVWVKYTKI